MQYRVFASHSMRPQDLPLVAAFADQLRVHQIDCYIAERDWKFGASLSQKIEAAIDNCDCLVAFLTNGGAASSYVNQEIGLALGKKKLVIPVLEKGVDLRGMQAGTEYVELDRQAPNECLLKLSQHLIKLKANKEVNTTMFWALVGIVAAIAGRK